MKALILAAGKSTRISSVSGGLPKPLIKVGETTILEHNLKWLSSQGVTDIWINLHYMPDAIREAIGDGSSTGTSVQYSLEDEILGTAGAVRKLRSEWDSSFMVVYGDNLLGFDIKNMTESHNASGAEATVALFNWKSDAHSGIAGGRVVMDDENSITGFIEGAESAAVSDWVNAGAYILEPSVTDRIPENSFCDFGHDIFPDMISGNVPFQGYPINSYCLAADTPAALERARTALANNDF